MDSLKEHGLDENEAFKLVDYFYNAVRKSMTDEEVSEYLRKHSHKHMIAEVCIGLEEDMGLPGERLFEIYMKTLDEEVKKEMESQTATEIIQKVESILAPQKHKVSEEDYEAIMQVVRKNAPITCGKKG